MARKDKKQIIGEPMSDEQIRAFLHGTQEQGEDPEVSSIPRGAP